MYKLNSALLILFSAFLWTACESEVSLEEEVSSIENNLTNSILEEGVPPKTFSILERMDYYKVPGASVAVLKDGELRWARAYGIANTETGSKVDENTLFQAASISKPVAALAALKLVEEGRITLDEDVNPYLKGWQIPESAFLKDEKVTLRRLMTHNAGMTVHGFPGYKPTDTFPSVIEVLEGKGNTSPIYVDTFPGSIWRYSGGGYTVMQKVVEDIAGMPFEDYMEQAVLRPMGMEISTFSQPLSDDLHSLASAAYDSEGELYEGVWHNYPEQAAAGLWTSPTELLKYAQHIQGIVKGKPGILSREMIEEMLTKHANDWGLGPSLGGGSGDSLVFAHGGKNAGFTNNFIAFAYKGDGVVVMTNADQGGSLMSEIIRSVANAYGWGFNKAKTVKTIPLTEQQIQLFPGRYKLDYEVDGIGAYFAEVSVEDGKIRIYDPNDGEISMLSALSESSFIELDDADEVEFQWEDGRVGFLWNGQFQFYKIEE